MARARRGIAALAAVLLVSGVAWAGGGEHGASEGEHGGGHALGEINWFQGMIGESDEGAAKNSWLWRPKGTPAPLGAMLVNSTIILWLVFRFGSKPIAQALRSRKATILAGMDEAAKMRRAAEARLADYEEKLAAIESDITRVRDEMRDAGSKECAQLKQALAERRARMERDGRLLVAQELEAARTAILHEAVAQTVAEAREALRKGVGPADHERLAQEFLASVASARSEFGGARS
ncbi:MAG: ATP synthase F0 subunit B [Polyangiaceae bacterium]|nr:ATP synthase F0 subunit B [Polyangiaceae bacterium]